MKAFKPEVTNLGSAFSLLCAFAHAVSSAFSAFPQPVPWVTTVVDFQDTVQAASSSRPPPLHPRSTV